MLSVQTMAELNIWKNGQVVFHSDITGIDSMLFHTPSQIDVSHQDISKYLYGTWHFTWETETEFYTLITLHRDGTFEATDYYDFHNGDIERFDSYSGDLQTLGIHVAITPSNPLQHPMMMYYTYSIVAIDACTCQLVDDEGTMWYGNKLQNEPEVSKLFLGEGTEENPYLISSCADLWKLTKDCANGKTYRDEYFRMTNDITFNTSVLRADGSPNDTTNMEKWIPIGIGRGFEGVFDGNNYAISGLFASGEDTIGLFGVVKGEIKNLTLKDSYMKGRSMVAGLVCYAKGTTIINNCHNKSTIEGTGFASGILGQALGNSSKDVTITINQCSNEGLVIALDACGIVYYCIGAVDILNCCNKGMVTTTRTSDFLQYGNIAGICGFAQGDYMHLHIMNCVNCGTVVGGVGIVKMINNRWAPQDKNLQYVYNCVNYGNATEAAIAYSINDYAVVCANYYLETSSAKCYVKSKSQAVINNNIEMTEKEMKAATFLQTLNQNASSFARMTQTTLNGWTTGEDGFPILDWIK